MPAVNATPALTRIGLATVLLGAFLSIADFFIVNVALPTIESDLHASSGTLELVVAGYGLPYALLLVLGGRLGDLYGRRRLFMLGMSAFTVTSLACGLAPTDETLVVFRAA
jgi:MFS family permease